MMSPCKVVAEIGINHQGDLATAFRLIDMAAAAGCWAVKFQKRDPEVSTPKEQWYVQKETPWGTVENYIDYRHKMEFDFSGYKAIEQHCDNAQIHWFASAWDNPSVRFLSQFQTPYIKIPSAKLTDTVLINRAADICSLILSTGMSTLAEIDVAVDAAHRHTHNQENILLHCHSGYPSPERELNLSLMQMYRERYIQRKALVGGIGFSSHAVSPFPAIYAAAWNADMIEVHITLDRALRGGDHAASLEEGGLKLLMREIERLPAVWGKAEKIVYESELAARKRLRGY